MLVVQFYEEMGKDLMVFLLTAAINDHRLSTDKLEHADTVLNNIIIKVSAVKNASQYLIKDWPLNFSCLP